MAGQAFKYINRTFLQYIFGTWYCGNIGVQYLGEGVTAGLTLAFLWSWHSVGRYIVVQRICDMTPVFYSLFLWYLALFIFLLFAFLPCIFLCVCNENLQQHNDNISFWWHDSMASSSVKMTAYVMTWLCMAAASSNTKPIAPMAYSIFYVWRSQRPSMTWPSWPLCGSMA